MNTMNTRVGLSQTVQKFFKLILLLLLTVTVPVATAATAPAVQPPERYRGIDLIVPSKIPGPAGTCNLGTTVSLPFAEKPKAVVLFIHGSGPMDRSGTIPGGTSIYRELSVRLAEAGFASIRFDKRTIYSDCATRIDDSFLASHFFDDIIAVHNASMALPELAGLPLYVFGHSQGSTFAIEMTARGLLAPRGLILVSGLGRFPIDATVIRQLKHVAASQSDKKSKKLAEAETKKAEDFFARLRRGTTRKSESMLGAYSNFWKDLQTLTEKTATSAAKVKASVIVLHGDADTQVTKEDFDALRGFFTSARQVRFRLFSNMSHLLTEGNEAGVSRAFSTEILNWIAQDLRQVNSN